jgi:hypothetical protein
MEQKYCVPDSHPHVQSMSITTKIVSSNPVTRYNIMWSSLAVISYRSFFFSLGTPVLSTKKSRQPRNNWNVVDSGVEYHIPMSIFPIGTICSAPLGAALETRIYLKGNCLRIISQLFLRINLHFSLPHS